jgi:hypothetical protein
VTPAVIQRLWHTAVGGTDRDTDPETVERFAVLLEGAVRLTVADTLRSDFCDCPVSRAAAGWPHNGNTCGRAAVAVAYGGPK